MEQDRIELLGSLLREIAKKGKDQDPVIEDFQFINFSGDIEGKGLIWSGSGFNKQIVFVSRPDRFFISDNVDIAKDKHISINNLPVLTNTELGTSVIKSNLKEVGRLKGLIVDGNFSVNSYLYYDANNDRLGIGTENPRRILDLVENNVEIILGSGEPNIGSIGTVASQDFQILTDSTSRISVSANGNIVLGNINTGPIHVNVLGRLTVNVNTPDTRANLQVNGPIKFNNKLHMSATSAPSGGHFTEGDIVWNSDPSPSGYVGWVCTRAGNPGIWNGFGKIE